MAIYSLLFKWINVSMINMNTIYFKTFSFLHLCVEVFEYFCIVFGLSQLFEMCSWLGRDGLQRSKMPLLRPSPPNGSRTTAKKLGRSFYIAGSFCIAGMAQSTNYHWNSHHLIQCIQTTMMIMFLSGIDHQRSGIWGARGQNPEFSSSVMPSRNIFG